MRCDGTRVMHEDPMYHLIPYFLTKRYDSMNMITLDIPEAPLRTYMNAKRREGKSVFYSLADEHVRTIIGQGMEHIEE